MGKENRGELGQVTKAMLKDENNGGLNNIHCSSSKMIPERVELESSVPCSRETSETKCQVKKLKTSRDTWLRSYTEVLAWP